MYKITGNVGTAIILLTLFIRTLLVPIILPSLKTLKKQQSLQPEINKLKEKYKYDQKLLATKQMELFKEHGINPMSGCLNQILMILVLIALYNVINRFTLHGTADLINQHLFFNQIKLAAGETLNNTFGYMDLTKPDPYFILAVLSGVFQFFASKMMIPYVEKAEKVAEKTEPKSDDLAFAMQQQSLYMMPIMNVIIGITLPSGVVLYILTTTIFSVVQTYFTSGWGGMLPWIKKIKKLVGA